MDENMHFENKRVYEDKSIINEYIDQDYLTAPEEVVLDLLRDKLPEMTMLDVAVGGGRTTAHFSNLVKKYVGVDYSAEMISACEKRFAGYGENISFSLADMRSLEMFDDNSFDFVLITFNAISTLTHEDRLKALQEFHRVGKPGGYFYFSAHNLQWVYRVMFNLRRQIFWLHPKITYWKLKRWLKLHKYNDANVIKNARHMPYAIVNDGAHNFRLKHYYITPSEQIKQLNVHFDNIRVFARDGHEILSEKELNTCDDGYLHYLCNFR